MHILIVQVTDGDEDSGLLTGSQAKLMLLDHRDHLPSARLQRQRWPASSVSHGYCAFAIMQALGNQALNGLQNVMSSSQLQEVDILFS